MPVRVVAYESTPARRVAKRGKMGRVVLFSLVIGLGLPACDRGGATGPAASAPARSPRTVVAEGGALIDVRTPEEFSGKHLDGAKNIPIDELSARLGEIPKDKPVVVYCHSGGRSAAAAKMLRSAGYDVLDIGTMKNW